jgi:hypothetical protein
MAIIQISRIQHRRGLDQDLPNLASAEFGWAVDTQKLYIGNGTLLEGAPAEGVTEILTENTNLVDQIDEYIFQGSQTGYTSQTGPDLLNPVERTLQDRLDDQVSVKAFGATGDGVTDDTAAVQRALDQVYFNTFAYTTPQLRRIVMFPAGRYIISNSLKIPGYAHLVGEGKDRTYIRQTDPNYAVMQLKDSVGNFGASYGTGSPSYPPRVLVEGMVLEQINQDKHIVELNASQDVTFRRVKFQGNTNGSSDRAGIYGRSTVGVDISHVTVDNCEFFNCYRGMDLVANVCKITNSVFYDSLYGITMDSTSANLTNYGVKITNNAFDAIKFQGIVIKNNINVLTNSITSANDFGANVGTGWGTGINSSLIELQGRGVYSVGDTHTRTTAAPGPLQRPIQTAGLGNVLIDNQEGITTGLARRSSGWATTLSSAQTNANSAILIASALDNAVRFNYTIRRDSASRVGTITVNFDGSNIDWTDEFSERPNNAVLYTPPGSTGTILTPTVAGSNVWLHYTTTAGSTAKITYSVDSLTQAN